MAITTSLARWVMSLATRAAPAARRDFARAMGEEFAVLDSGRLAWAFGCLTTVAGWRLRADGLFLAAMITIAVALDQIMAAPFWVLPGDLVHAIAYYYWLAFPAVAYGLLAVWRPRHAYASTLVMWLIREALNTTFLFSMLDGAPLGRGWHIMDAPPIVGWSALLGWSLLGAAIGKRIGQRRIARSVEA
jgi:hypothetical protein